MSKILLECDWCGEIFERYLSQVYKNNFCSHQCKGKWQSENRIGENAANWNGGRIKINCAWCDKEKEIEFWHYKRNISAESMFFCDLKCEGKYRSKYLIGDKAAHWQGGKISLYCDNCGIEISIYKPLLDKHNKHFCSSKCQYSYYRGEQHYSYIGNSDYYPREFYDQIENIHNRDDNQCQLCFKHELEYSFHVHHINYNKQNNDDINLILLCRSCHPKTNFNRDYWEGYFQNIMKNKYNIPNQALEVI